MSEIASIDLQEWLDLKAQVQLGESMYGRAMVVFAEERDAMQAENAKLWAALEECRLFAARHRKEEWAPHVLRFCADAGMTGSPLRKLDNSEHKPL